MNILCISAYSKPHENNLNISNVMQLASIYSKIRQNLGGFTQTETNLHRSFLASCFYKKQRCKIGFRLVSEFVFLQTNNLHSLFLLGEIFGKE